MEVRKSQNLRDVINEWPLFLLDKFSKSKDSFSNVQNKRQTMFLFFTFSLININYCNHLNTRLVWYSNDRFLYGCQMVRYSNGGLKKACLRSKMSGIQMVCQNMRLYHLNTGHPYCPVFRWLLYCFLFQLQTLYREHEVKIGIKSIFFWNNVSVYPNFAKAESSKSNSRLMLVNFKQTGNHVRIRF